MEPDGVGVARVYGTGVGEGAGKDGIAGVEPGGDDRIADGDETVLNMPVGKPGQRPQYSWQYALQASKSWCYLQCFVLFAFAPTLKITHSCHTKLSDSCILMNAEMHFAATWPHLKYCPMGVEAEQVSLMLPGSRSQTTEQSGAVLMQDEALTPGPVAS